MLVIREMQIKTSVRYLLPTRLAVIKKLINKPENNKC